MHLAPIVLFAYNRARHTKLTLEALEKNELSDQSVLIIYADGPKENASEEDKKKIQEVRTIIKEKQWCKSVEIIESEKNNGLAYSIIKGVSEVVEKYGKVIVLEDDLITSPCFLKYMNEALDLYKDEENVYAISGFMYPLLKKIQTTSFISFGESWGWGTWKRAWDFFEPDGKKLLDQLIEKNLTRKFDFNSTSPFTQMLKDQISGKNNSWAIRWCATIFLKEKFMLVPGISLVKNIGNDGSGTHSGLSDSISPLDLLNFKINVNKIPIKESKETRKAIAHFFLIYNRSVNRTKRILLHFKKLWNHLK